jgi:hypothetical protein
MEIAANVKQQVEKHGKHSAVRMSFVAYRDWETVGVYDDPGEVVCCEFTEDIAILKEFLSNQNPVRGHDEPEDICGGLHKASQLKWSSNAKYMFIIGDSPCHGSKYHSMRDNFPDGDPLRMIPEKQLEDLMRPNGKYGTRGINVTFVRIRSRTDQMIQVWNQHLLDTISRQVKCLDLSSSVSDLAGDFSKKIQDEIIRDWFAHHF